MSTTRVTLRQIAGAIAETRRRLEQPKTDAHELLLMLNGAGSLKPPRTVPPGIYDDIHAALDLIDGARLALAHAAAIARWGRDRTA